MPSARRMSNSSVASASSQQCFPATVQSSTKVSKEKVAQIMNRRKSRRLQPSKQMIPSKVNKVDDKENCQDPSNVLQSPTPYWKVAKEKGTNTPPQTRSARKKRKTQQGGIKLNFDSEKEGLLQFSPPNQAENARREKEEIDRKEKARASRVKKARDSGQLLVYSPTLRNSAPLPLEAEGNDNENENEHGSTTQSDDDAAKSPGENTDDSDHTPYKMEVEVSGRDSEEKSEVSCVTQPTMKSCEKEHVSKELAEANEALKQCVASYEERVYKLENEILPQSEEQLQRTVNELQQFKESEIKLRKELETYKKQIESLTKELAQVNEEKEQERVHFQALNEESSLSFHRMRSELQSKDEKVKTLEQELETASSNYNSVSGRLKQVADELKSVRSRVDTGNSELQRMLEDATSKLQQSEEEKEQLEKKLANALTEIEKSATAKKQLKQRIYQLEQGLHSSESQHKETKIQLETFNEREAELYGKLQESDRVRRALHNRVIQLSGNIRVFVRVRPVLKNEMEAITMSKPPTGNKKRKHAEIEEYSPFHYPGMGGKDGDSLLLGADDPTKNLLEITEPWKDRGGLSERRKKWKFGFDNIFTPEHVQEDVWEATHPLVQSTIDGYNVTVFAYGQTGSGKTHTMLGEPGNEGLVYRSIKMLFAAKKSIAALTRNTSKVEISVELLEVYNEEVRDLLKEGKKDDQKSLKVKANAAVGSTVTATEGEEEVFSILDKAQKRRCVKATASNAVSSRSHMLFTLHFKVTEKGGQKREGKLNVCDLAGSERLSKSNANENVGGSLLKETKHINTSLSVLSNVIEKLQAGKTNVPFRESKLTQLLQNSLGGNSKTLAIVCCNPLQSHFHESLSSLRFAAKVNKVDLKAVANFSA